ncbi:MAG: NAD-glutamate dehydrogenase [Acidobacteriota bacterium]|nr:NAD-glutamate dehydrogenase [Acidobacteriota bacterium]
MITEDPKKRAQITAHVIDILARKVSPEDKNLIASFAPVILSEASDRILFLLPPETVAERLLRHYNFVVHEVPSSIQLFKGPPGIHVSVYNPCEEEAIAMGGGAGLPLETTVVRTHTLDAPFIFESLKNYFSKAGLRVYSAVHPVFTVRRQWERIVWIGEPHEEGPKESYCYFQIEPVDSKEQLRRMQHEIFSILKCVFLAVEDFQPMLALARTIARQLRDREESAREVDSARDFIAWLLDENYVFLGIARYSIAQDGRPHRLTDNATGVFNDPELLPIVFPGLLDEIESHLCPEPGDSRIVSLDFCRNASAIHHLYPIDYIVLRHWDPQGNLAGASLLLGRFSRGTFGQRTERIPILREKIHRILREIGAPEGSHVYRELVATYSRMPLRELFYSSPAALKSLLEPIAFMVRDEDIVVRARKGAGYVSLAIAFSRLRYSYGGEQNIARALAAAFGPVSFHTSADCGSVHLLLYYFDLNQLDAAIEEEEVLRIVVPLIARWEDSVSSALEARFGEREGRRLFRRYVTHETRSGLYREVTPPDMVPEDLVHLENLEARLEVRTVPLSPETAMLHLYSIHALGLTDTLKTLENLGLEVIDEIRIPLLLPESRQCYLYRYEVRGAADCIAALKTSEERFIEALRRLDEKRATDDALNRLILSVGLSWREVEVLRTVRNYLLQIRPYYTSDTLNRVLLNNSAVSAALFSFFAARFDPALDAHRPEAMNAAEQEVLAALENVKSLAEDEILRAAYNILQSLLRTNFYQVPERPVVSIKIDSRKVDVMPDPRPMFEIYVHSNRLEGIHLRGGRVARGGIRWSDRPDDFRTEILGLMQTQMLKNTIIVPVGSKGGFVLKGEVPAPPAIDNYLINRYSEFISGLLDVTDNIVEGTVLHPPEVVRHDGDDPYLVVAADKGTAHLSNTANNVSLQYGYWLGDAFASGGKTGYDHKKIGITARGAWECVKHHFRNLGMDIQAQPFTAVGIGDMSGDVFGNGMLLSRATKLVAAFDHRHIFIDPNPDMEKSYQERERMFRLPRSSWKDYDRSVISEGGGVFDRSARAIRLSPAAQTLLGIHSESASGEEVIRRILTAPVDLLYNGGIGTYVKAAAESNADVGDHNNDRVRVNAADVRARVVGEGGNRGFTQQARIEYWMSGGQINTDAIDNSGGVDTSDHEVNIKILLDLLVKKGIVPNKEARNRMLAEMEGDVAALVLEDNRNQARALTLDGLRSAAHYDEFVDLVGNMERNGMIDRSGVQLPSRDSLLQSPQKARGLPRPLLADLLGYAKMWVYEKLVRSSLPDNPVADPFLQAYFPKPLGRDFSGYFAEHPLRREIIATAVVNYVLNNGGIRLLPRLMAELKMSLEETVLAYLAADAKAAAAQSRQRVLESGLAADAEHAALLKIEDAVEAAVLKR